MALIPKTSRKPLIAARPGIKLKIILVEGNHTVKSYLAQLGLSNFTLVEVINCTLWGPVMISVRGSRLALGRDLASMIFVEEVELA